MLTYTFVALDKYVAKFSSIFTLELETFGAMENNVEISIDKINTKLSEHPVSSLEIQLCNLSLIQGVPRNMTVGE